MANIKKQIITTAGLNLIAKFTQGTVTTIGFTKLKIGDGQYTTAEQTDAALAARTSMKSEKNNFSISAVTQKTSTSTVVRSIISNSAILTGYYVREFGLYAQDTSTSTEILFAIAIAEDDKADYLPAYNGTQAVEVTVDDYIEVSNASAFTLVYSEGAFATSQMLDDVTQSLEEKIDLKLNTSLKGASNGLAELVGGKVPSTQLPSYVDDVLEYENLAAFPTTGEGGKIYLATDTGKSYRWGGSSYAIVSDPDILAQYGLGDYSKDISGTDLYLVTKGGKYKGQNVTNAPSTGWFYFDIDAHTATYRVITSTHLTSGVQAKKILNNGTWGGWVEKIDASSTQTMTNKTLTSPKVGTAILDVNGNEVIKTPATADAVNEFTITNAATGTAPTFQASGGDANIAMNFATKGLGDFIFWIGTVKSFVIGAVANAVNYVVAKGSVAGSGVVVQASGTDTDIDINVVPKGNGKVNLTRASGALAAIMETAGGTATAITLNYAPLTAGSSVSFVCSASNTGAATTINAKALYKPGGTSAPNLVAGKAYTVWYNGTNFFIKASAEGDAVAANVLAGKTFSNDGDTGLVGTMAAGHTITIDGAAYESDIILNSYYTWANANVSTIPFTFVQGTAAVLNGEIHIVRDTYHYKWNGTSWVSVSTLPISFGSYACLVVLNGEIHALWDTAHYKWNGTVWTSVSTLPYDIHTWACFVVLNGEIHALWSTSQYTAHYKWNGTVWTSVSTLPYIANSSGDAVVLDGEIHILGGYYNLSVSTSHYKWNGTVWTSVSTLPFSFTEAPAVVIGSDIFILGSSNAVNDTGKINYVYMFKSGKWSYVASGSITYPKYSAAVVLNGEIHILGGVDDYQNQQTSHYKIGGISYRKKG